MKSPDFDWAIALLIVPLLPVVLLTLTIFCAECEVEDFDDRERL
jgi:hypothetical protein